MRFGKTSKHELHPGLRAKNARTGPRLHGKLVVVDAMTEDESFTGTYNMMQRP